MSVERSAGAIICRKENNQTIYLLLRYSAKSVEPFWDLPKGHTEQGENELEAAMREVKEETGLIDIEFVEGFREQVKYAYQLGGQLRSKIVTFYLAETNHKDIKTSPEHVGYVW